MATNQYFKYGVRSEQQLFEDLVIESLQMFGQDVYYLPREVVNKDKIFLDDVPSRFSDAYKIEMYIENTEGFEGEGDLFTKFGIELRDQATFIVSRRRWVQMVGKKLEVADFRPREGDLIFLPMSESMFEIRKVETETPFYQLKDLPTFRLQVELFEYNDEDFDTGINDIQEIEELNAYTYELRMDSQGTPGYIVGETVTQTFATYNMTGEVSYRSDSDDTLRIVHTGATDGLFHEWTTSAQVKGETTLTYATPTLVKQLQQIQGDAQNSVFDDFESDFLDFTENNPFGDAS